MKFPSITLIMRDPDPEPPWAWAEVLADLVPANA
jgi:hypothetical protein